MNIGNKAKLVNSEVCKKCGKCCKVFQMSETTDIAVRFGWMNKKIKAEDTIFRFGDGQQEKKITFKFPCKQLEFKDGKYSCKVYNEERPDFCNTYPDHIFYNVERWNRERIQKILEDERNICIGLKDVNTDDVIKMLNEKRENKEQD